MVLWGQICLLETRPLGGVWINIQQSVLYFVVDNSSISESPQWDNRHMHGTPVWCVEKQCVTYSVLHMHLCGFTMGSINQSQVTVCAGCKDNPDLIQIQTGRLPPVLLLVMCQAWLELKA
jgi:hypothetical protein